MAGFTGQITANSFMKREFGKKLIEQFLPSVDLTHVIDTSGAYIPGHGTPTTILLGHNRPPVASTIRTVMGIKGEPSTPEDPAEGLVWTAIVDQIDQPGSESDYVSGGDSERERFAAHPWSIGGGGAAELKGHLENDAPNTLKTFIDVFGASVVTREDNVYQVGTSTALRQRIEREQVVATIDGEHVRDWQIDGCEHGICPYDPITFDAKSTTCQSNFLWLHRTGLAARVAFGKASSAESVGPKRLRELSKLVIQGDFSCPRTI